MCFYIHPRHKEVKIAKKDITCYKVLHKKGKLFESLHQNFLYEPEECYYENQMRVKNSGWFNLNNNIPEKIIETGLHSFSTKPRAEVNLGHMKPYYKRKVYIVECTIPEGAKYYYNPENSEYVSNYLIIGKKPL